MDEAAMDHVRAFIATARVPEMQTRGWRVVGRGEEGSLLMEGPMPESRPMPVGDLLNDLFEELVAHAMERADAWDGAGDDAWGRVRKAA
jgi:hypothetical protein